MGQKQNQIKRISAHVLTQFEIKYLSGKYYWLNSVIFFDNEKDSKTCRSAQ